jgi:hypothetical protein
MTAFSSARFLVIFAVIVSGAANVSAAQSSAATPLLSLDDVVKESKSGIPDDIIITKIKKNNRPFNLSTDEIQELSKSGISDTIIKYLLDPSQPYSSLPPAPAPPTPSGNQPSKPPEVRTKSYPADARASRVPADPGLYHFAGDAPEKTELRLLLGENEGGLTKVITKKGRAIGYLVGSMANMKTSEATPVFYLRLPEGKPIEEVVLLALTQTKERREIVIGPSLDKQQLKAESMRPFDSLEVGPRLFKVTPSQNLTKGEYLFLLLGSAEPPKGTYGKVYDFSIQAPHK